MVFTNGDIPPVLDKIVETMKDEANHNKLHVSDVEKIITNTRICKGERDKIIQYLVNAGVIRKRGYAIFLK